jgi:MFS family permease
MSGEQPAPAGRPAAPARGRLPAALRQPSFVRLWAGSIVSSVGTQMSNVAKLWVLYLLTHSAFALGLEGLCFSVPILVVPLVAGPIADRVDRRTVLRLTMAAEVAEAGALAAVAVAGAFHPWIIYLTAGLEACRLAFDIPARMALTSTLVPGEALLSAQSLSAVVWSSASLAGPAIGGVLLATAGAAVVFAINGIITAAALVAFLPLRRARLHPVPGDAGTPAGMTGGLRFAWGRRELLGLAAVLAATSALVIGTESLLPVLDRTLWHGGSAAYGLLRMAPGIAAILAGAGLSAMRPVRRPARAIAISLAAGCGGLIAFTGAPVLAAAIALLVLASLALTLAQVHIVTRIQQVTPDQLRGAISGLSAISQSGLGGIAAAGLTMIAESLGARTTITGAVAVTASAVLLCSAAARRRRTRPAAGNASAGARAGLRRPPAARPGRAGTGLVPLSRLRRSSRGPARHAGVSASVRGGGG